MEEYMEKYEKYEKKIVYDFNIGDGGIGDCIKFFICALNLCIKNNYKLYYKINNITLEKYIKLKYTKMYIKKEDMLNSRIINNVNDIENISNNNYNIVIPQLFYKTFNFDNCITNIQDIFYFTDDVKINSNNLMLPSITDYISLHLRLGDKYLETDQIFINCKNDTRFFSEEKLFNFIEKNYNRNILFLCDNKNYKEKIKNKYNNIIITNCDIGHTSLLNTTNKQILDAVTEFYLITQSEKICAVSCSGFSIIASKFKNVPLINLYL